MILNRETGALRATAVGGIERSEAVRNEPFLNRAERNVGGVVPQLMVVHAGDRVAVALVPLAVAQPLVDLPGIIGSDKGTVVVLNLRGGQEMTAAERTGAGDEDALEVECPGGGAELIR